MRTIIKTPGRLSLKNASFLLRCHIWLMECKREKSSLLTFVPKHEPVRNQDVKILQSFVDSSSHMMIITGECEDYNK